MDPASAATWACSATTSKIFVSGVWVAVRAPKELILSRMLVIISEMSSAIDELSDKMEHQNRQLEERVDKLERWRMLLIGGGLVIGFIVSRLADNLFNFLLASRPQ